jgi:gliding motility-associated-like protein
MTLTLTFASTLNAEHVYGGDITYTSLGNDQYQIFVTLFYDCESATDPSEVYVWAFNVVDGTPRLLTATEIYSGSVDSTYNLNLCLNPPPGTCVKKEIYSVITTLESGLGGFSLHLEEFNRSPNVLNLNNPENYGAIFYCTVPDPSDPFSGGAHNGPTFNLDPPPNICVNDTVRFDHSVTDVDGDVIIYSFCDPKGRIGVAGAGPEFIPRPYSTVPWAIGYSTKDQLPSATPFTLDPNTGLLEGVADQLGQYVYSVCFEEFRNGVLINEGNRDYMFNITNCTPEPTDAIFDSQSQTIEAGYCGDLGVQFRDTSINAMSYLWDFGDNDTSSQENPFHRYSAPGDYWVTLTINEGMTCEMSVTKLFEVYYVIDSISISNISEQCENSHSFDFEFTGNYNPENSITWDFGPNGIPATSSDLSPQGIKFAVPGMQNISLTVDNKTCSYTDNLSVLVKPSPTAIFTLPDSLCISDTLMLISQSLHSSNRTIRWAHVGANVRKAEGDSIKGVVYFQTGYSYIRLIVEDNGCSDTLIDSLYVQQLPEPTIEINSEKVQCFEGNSFSLNIGGFFSPNASYNWTFNQNASISTSKKDSLVVNFDSIGFHVFRLDVKDGPCYVSLIDSIFVSPDPIPDFTLVSNSCLILDTVDFIFTGSNGDSANYTWNFGDSTRWDIHSTSSINDTSIYQFTFQDTGEFIVSLSIEENGCLEVFKDTFYVAPAPTSYFISPTTQCIIGNSFDFNHLGNYSNPGTSTHWDFGIYGPEDTNIANPNNISFDTTGLHIITLTTIFDNCISVFSDTIHISPEPLANFDFIIDTCISSSPLNFIFNGIAGDSAIYSWDFGADFIIDSISSDSDRSVFGVQYATIGQKMVSIYVEENGCSSIYSQSFELFDAPMANYTAGAPQCILINDFDFFNEGTYSSNAKFEWNFGPLGPPSRYTENVLGLSFDAAALHTVELIITEYGCTDTFPQQILVTAEPNVFFAKQDTQCIANNSFDFVANGYFSKASSFAWDLGSDGTPNVDSVKKSTVTFSDTGWHVVSVTVYEYGCTDTYTDSVYISPVPNVYFQQPENQCISGNSYDFLAEGTFDTQATFEWIIPSGTPNYSNQKELNGVRFSEVGFNEIELRVHSHGCMVVYIDSADLSPGPVGIVAQEEAQCILVNSFNFDYSGSTYTTNTDFMWVFGDRANLDTVNLETPPAISYDTTGRFNVYLILQEDTCLDIFTTQVRVTPPPISNFKITTDSIQCIAGNSFEFINTGKYGDSAHFTWSFGGYSNPTNSLQENPTMVRWDTLGWHYVSLEIEENGCSDYYEDSIFITPTPTPIILPVDSQCIASNSFNFDGLSSISDTNGVYSWDLGSDATPSFSAGKQVNGVTFSDTGWHQVRLSISENGCIVIDTSQFYITAVPTSRFEIANAITCIDVNNFDFKNTGSYSLQASWKWYFENANIDSLSTENAYNISFNDTGYHSIKLIVTDLSCSHYYTDSVYVTTRPDPYFSNSEVQCFKNNSYDFQALNITDNSTQISWAFENASPDSAIGDIANNVVFHEFGWQQVNLFYSLNGCTKAYTDSVFLSKIPIPIIQPVDSQCVASNSYNFDGLSSIHDTNAVFFWDFGSDASPSNAAGKLVNGVTFTDTGWHQIILNISENGCDSNQSINFYVNPEPVSGFIVSDSTTCLHVNSFDFISTGSYSEQASWTWYFENSSTDSLSSENVSGISFNDTGYQIIELIVTDFSCTSSFIDSVYVEPVPDIYFVNSEIQCVDNNQYNFQAENISDSSTQVAWYFENASPDSAIGFEANNIVFQDTGWQTVNLNFSLNGCDRSYVDSVFIIPRSQPYFANKTVQCVGNNSYDFLGEGSYSDSATFYWVIENASIDTGFGLNQNGIIFDQIGYHQVAFYINDIGCADVYFDSIFISPPPISSIDSVPSQCITGNSFDFSASKSSFDDSAVFQWSFENALPSSSNLENPSGIVFQVAGTHLVNLIISDNGCIDSSGFNIYISEHPNAEWNLLNSDSLQCILGNIFNFQATDITYESNAIFNWDFGINGNPSSGNSDMAMGISFDSSGFELIELTVSEYQCSDSFIDTVWISPRPIPVLRTKETQCLNNNYYSFDATLGSYGPNATFLWDFGANSSISSDTNAYVDSVSFSSTGIQTYSLTISENGCDSTVFGSLQISDFSDSEFVTNTNNQCITGNAFRFTSVHVNTFSPNAAYFFTIENDTFRTSSTIYSFSDTGAYTIKFTVIDFGCRDSSYETVTVYPETEAYFNYSPFEGCAPLTVNFKDSSSSYRPLYYYWKFGDGNIDSIANPTNTYQNSGRYDVMLIATADSFCTMPDSFLIPNAVYVHKDPTSAFTASTYSSSMFDPEITFYSNSGDTVSSSFIIERQTFVGDTISYVFPDTGWYDIHHIVITPIGCLDTSVQSIYIEPEYKFFSPNAFSPNNDGINDVFLQKGYAILSYELRIFTRWGEQIFLGKDPSSGWDGRSGDIPAKEDIYIWRTKVIDVFGKEWKYKGSVTLIK